MGAGQGTLTTYVIGFVLSLALTLEAYALVINHVLSGSWLLAAIMATAVVQLMVQLIFFLHLGSESKPKWNLVVFLFMLMVLFILVLGSLWIMHNLNYHMMSPAETNTYIIHDEGINPNPGVHQSHH
ncbi:MAG TPA: cytochrome o ubiquinol oxidase subunit IV [Candidatus Polarisedimenticolaceae bacterium]|nr:cytochrome o ubiquinol oxidase subunit IV [Candidatus Polarisedimenticolaceae bacterium]